MHEGRSTVAVITIARDEGTMLRRWVAHYSAQVGAESVFVVDDCSSDGSTDDLPCVVLRTPGLPGADRFEPSRMKIASHLQMALLVTYDAVVFCDADEFLVADPTRYPDLRDFVARRDTHPLTPWAGLALNVVHTPGEEPLDPGRPVLEQRSYAKFIPVMCKPSLTMVPARWMAASHGIAVPYRLAPDLFMLHLKYADLDHLRETADRRHALTVADGRAKSTSWALTGDEIVESAKSFIADADPASAPEFDPSALDLDALVTVSEVRNRVVHRAPTGAQSEGMVASPLVRIPSRLAGAL